MMNFTVISEKITNGITSELSYSEEKKELISYAIETALLSICGSLLIICLGFLSNALIPVVIAAICGSLLRRLSGGAHFNTPFKCLIYGAVIYTLIGVAAKELVNYSLTNQYVLIVLLLISFFLVAFLAPVDCVAKPINSRSLRFKLKISSTAFVLISCIVLILNNNSLVNVSMVLGISYQSLTLLPIFNRRGGEYSL
ncbi:MAG: accessory gene regulator B family protein [Desulfosporosinus sp.]|nr:accessory gene regulator B family protein [Desulfosporosinus sp.]MBC2726523.1 accessory gene regulator B family protein [Desulfosporosinus sp.]